MRLLRLLLVSVACAAGVAAAPPLSAEALQPGWIADARTGCRVWNPTAQPGMTVTWTGGCRDTLAQGNGNLQWFKDGKPTDRYSGDLRDGKKSGRGIYTLADGFYDGEYRDDKKNGRGVAVWWSGGRYDGEWRDDKASGRGIYVSSDGVRYDGEWRDGKANGTGTVTLPDGRTYSGIAKNGCFDQGGLRAAVGVTHQECGWQ